jgi:hypothetical protein
MGKCRRGLKGYAVFGEVFRLQSLGGRELPKLTPKTIVIGGAIARCRDADQTCSIVVVRLLSLCPLSVLLYCFFARAQKSNAVGGN